MKKFLTGFVMSVMLIIGITVSVCALGNNGKLSREAVELFPGDSFRVAVSYDNSSCTFYTNDESVASVTQDGIITAIKAGTTKIRCVDSRGNTSECEVKVKSGKGPETVVLSDNVITMVKGDKYTLGVRVIPDKESAYKKFVSSDENVAAVDTEGNITAQSIGTAVVTVETESTAVSAGCIVNVVDSTEQNNKKVDVCGVLYNASGDKMQNTVVSLSDGAYSAEVRTNEDGKFAFSNVNPGRYVFTVSSGTMSGEGISANVVIYSGETRLSCILSDTSLSVMYGSNVSSANALRGIEFTQKNIDLVTGDTYDTGVILTPVSSGAGKLIYTSENTDVADVDNTGRIIALNEGGTVIRVSNEEGTVTDKMTVNVKRYGTGMFGTAIFIMLSFIAVLIITVYFHLKRRGQPKRYKKIANINKSM